MLDAYETCGDVGQKSIEARTTLLTSVERVDPPPDGWLPEM